MILTGQQIHADGENDHRTPSLLTLITFYLLVVGQKNKIKLNKDISKQLT